MAYPKTVNKKKEWVLCPIQITEQDIKAHKKLTKADMSLKVGKFVCVQVLAKGYTHLFFPVVHDTLAAAQRACDAHNSYAGYTEKEVNNIIAQSMELAAQK